MSSAIRLRKSLLSVLQGKILPDLQGKAPLRLVTARLPLKTPAGIVVGEMPYPPLREADATRIYPGGANWQSVHMHTPGYPTLHCVVEGEADLLMGVTTSMLDAVSVQDKPEHPCGGYIVSLPAPGYFLVPPEVPQRTGALPPWYRTEPHTGTARILNVRVLPIGALCNITTMERGHSEVQYSLLIEDDQLAPIVRVLLNEEGMPARDPQISRAQLLSLMLRLQRGMSAHIPPMTDGIHSRFPSNNLAAMEAQPSYHPLVQKVQSYIQLHLHRPLTPADVAAHVRLTPAQLNRVLRKHTGMSIMGYVTCQRMEVAQLLLHTSEQPVQEIANLVGLHRASHFTRTFQRHTGLSPLNFRQQQEGPLVKT